MDPMGAPRSTARQTPGVPDSTASDLKAALKEIALREGASLLGIASIERFEGAPAGHGPARFHPARRGGDLARHKVP